MKGDEHSDLALVLRTRDYSESSVILVCLTREHGLVDGLAKGARRERSPLRFICDLGLLWQLEWRARRSSLGLITGGRLLEDYAGLRASLPRLYGQGVVIDLLRGFALAGEPQPELFDRAQATLLALAAGGPVLPYCLTFVAAALVRSGFGPQVERCLRCGGGRGPFRYLSQEGGIACARCAQGGEGRALGPAARSLLADLLAERLRKPERVRLRPQAWEEAAGALLGSVRVVLERDLPALAWLVGLAVDGNGHGSYGVSQGA